MPIQTGTDTAKTRRTLKAGEHYGGGLPFQFERGGRFPHEFGEFLMGDFDEQLTRLNRSQHLSSQGFFLDSLDKRLGGFEVHVGIE